MSRDPQCTQPVELPRRSRESPTCRLSGRATYRDNADSRREVLSATRSHKHVIEVRYVLVSLRLCEQRLICIVLVGAINLCSSGVLFSNEVRGIVTVHLYRLIIIRSRKLRVSAGCIEQLDVAEEMQEGLLLLRFVHSVVATLASSD